MPHCCGGSHNHNGEHKQTETFSVKGMTCNHCVMSIEKAVRSLSGVDQVNVDLGQGKVSVVYDPSRVSSNAIIEAIEEAGYEVS